MKRKRLEDSQHESLLSHKRKRATKHHLLHFTDEIILKILSSLAVRDINNVERVSQRLRRLATDSAIWQEKYFIHYVVPRISRIYRSKQHPNVSLSSVPVQPEWWSQIEYPYDDLSTDWKRLFKIRTNWWFGRCKRREVEVAEPSTPAAQCAIHQGIVFTVDDKEGLRAWSKTSSSHSLTSCSPPNTRSARHATTLAIDTTKQCCTHLVVGYSDGALDAFNYTPEQGFELASAVAASSNGPIDAAAITYPYIVTMSDGKVVSLYEQGTSHSASDEPNCRLLMCIESENSFSPVSLFLRKMRDTLTACIAYPFSRLGGSRWYIGLQELHISTTGAIIGSRIASLHDDYSTSTRLAVTQPFPLHPDIMERPSSLCYAHPYLVATLADNTLIVYNVRSDLEKLEIEPGRRLWGHTSAISNVMVDTRGKAVSISARGDDIHIWEVEGLKCWRNSIQIRPTHDSRLTATGIKKHKGDLARYFPDLQEETPTGGWVGFDDEEVVVLGERSKRQIMSSYDFDIC